jgi:hypothetical protein
MPAITFPDYAQEVGQVLNSVVAAGEATLVNIQIDQRSSLRGFISGMLQFNNDNELHFREFIDTSLSEPRLMYAYHYQDSDHNLLFRYDNARHRPSLPQAEHKHTRTGIEAGLLPTLTEVIDEILRGMQS